MDGMDLTTLVQIGEQTFMAKLFVTGVHYLWIYDYLLTLGDEIKYAWPGRRSWIFVLFIANRYTPVLHFIWIHIVMFHYTKSFCQATKWFMVFHSIIITVFAQVLVALRIYAITGKNKLLGGTFALFITAQFSFGIFCMIRIALRPLRSLSEINLDTFTICAFKQWRSGDLIYTSIAIIFDVLTFLIILYTAKRSGAYRHPGIPCLLDTILRDATLHFTLVFYAQVLSQFFLLLAPEEIRLLPGVANTIIISVMASRLMLSLKKAAAEPNGQWSLETMNDPSSGRLAGDGSIRFASRVPGESDEISEDPAPPNEEDRV